MSSSETDPEHHSLMQQQIFGDTREVCLLKMVSDTQSPHHSDEVFQSISKHSSNHLFCVLT